MISYKWSILEIYKNLGKVEKVRYLLKAQDEQNAVETEGYHSFFNETVYKSYEETKEEDLIRWLDKDTTQDEINLIKLNLEKQLEALKTSKKVVFPWEIDTFTIG